MAFNLRQKEWIRYKESSTLQEESLNLTGNAVLPYETSKLFVCEQYLRNLGINEGEFL